MSTETLTARIAAALDVEGYGSWIDTNDAATDACLGLGLNPDWCGPVVALTPELQRLIAIGRYVDMCSAHREQRNTQ